VTLYGGGAPRYGNVTSEVCARARQWTVCGTSGETGRFVMRLAAAE